MTESEKRILVVDDDTAIRTLLLTILQRRRMSVDAAKNGREAIEMLGRCQYVLMLLDLMMPELSGWDVLEHLARQAAARRPLIILLTAGTEARDINPELVIANIRKPFDVELLHDLVIACLSAVDARQQLPGCPPSEIDRKNRPTNEVVQQ